MILQTFVLLFGYFAAFEVGKMTATPKAQWKKAPAGQNAFMSGDWFLYQKIYMGVVGVAVLLTLISAGGGMMGGGGFGGGMFGGGGYGGGGYGY